MRRRGFLRRTATGAGMASGAALPYAVARLIAPPVAAAPVRRPRPLPGALADKDAFAAACIGCGLCAEVCPPACIAFHTRDGGPLAGTPYIDPERRGCTLCGKCMQVCPTEALTEVPRTQIDMGIAEIDRTACYPWVDHGICGACAVVCPLGDRAIGFDFANMYRPVVREECVGCGVCVEVCPHPSLPIGIVDRAEGSVTGHARAG